MENLNKPDDLSTQRAHALLLRILLLAFAFKLFIAVILPLGLDEAYAIAVAREYSLSFFDHPPLSFWAPVAMADLTGIEHDLIYRLPFLAAGVITTYLMYLIGHELGGKRAGVWSALLYTTAPFLLVSGGFVAVPDGLLNLGSAAAVLGLMKVAKTKTPAPLRLWLLIGLSLAFALGSKYQAAWIPVAVLLYMIFTPNGRSWFRQPGPWLGGLIGLLGLLPVVLWNMQNDWASFAFHGDRAGGGLNIANWGQMAVTQALFLLPTGLIAGIAGLRLALSRPALGLNGNAPFLLALIALGPILIFNGIYLFSNASLAHWAMPGWQFSLPLAALWLTRKQDRSQRRFLGWTLGLFGLIWISLLTLVFHANTGFLTRNSAPLPQWDRTISLFNYQDLLPALKARGIWDQADLFMATSWAGAGIFDTALQGEKPMRVFVVPAAHHFTYITDAKATGRAIYLEAVLKDNVKTTQATLLRNARTLDGKATLLPVFALKRGERNYVYMVMVRLVLE